MIIRESADLTAAVLREVEKAQDPRLREILTALVRHLHGFVREVRLTEDEFRAACAFVAALGHHTNPAHNEVVLMAGSLGVSTLVCLLNNGSPESMQDIAPLHTTANLLGPFWRPDAPDTPDGGSLLRSPTQGEPLFVTVRVEDSSGRPVSDAIVDVWHSSAEGFYENQDPSQADMNLRGRLRTDAAGLVRFRTIKPRGYPIPVTGPVGQMLRALTRHNMRPAHLHFLIFKEGFKTHISQIYVADDPHLESDVQFGVTGPVVGDFRRHEQAPPPEGEPSGVWYSLEQTFRIQQGAARWPRAPITGKVDR